KKVKCTGVVPCANCERTRNRCEFTGTAKKRGPRNGTVEVIKSPAKRIENALKKDPSLKDTFDDLLAKKNFCPSVHPTRPPSSITPTNASIVIIDDDTGIATDRFQSHCIPRSTYANVSGNYSNPVPLADISRQRNVPMNLNVYPRDDVSSEICRETGREFDQTSTILRRPVALYPQVMHTNHVTNGVQFPKPHQDNVSPATNSSPPKSHSLPGNYSETPRPCSTLGSLPPFPFEPLTLPPPWALPPRKSMPMPIFGSSSGMQVLLPPAPDVENPLNPWSKYTTPQLDDPQNLTLKPLNVNNDDNSSHHDIDFYSESAAINFPSPSSLSPKSSSPGIYQQASKKFISHTPTYSLSPPQTPRSYSMESSRPAPWCNDGGVETRLTP
ncbi:14973_t:CDS:2, partial [Acaulospora colombiana]